MGRRWGGPPSFPGELIGKRLFFLAQGPVTGAGGFRERIRRCSIVMASWAGGTAQGRWPGSVSPGGKGAAAKAHSLTDAPAAD